MMVVMFSVGASNSLASASTLVMSDGITSNFRIILMRYVGVPEANQYEPNFFSLKQFSKL